MSKRLHRRPCSSAPSHAQAFTRWTVPNRVFAAVYTCAFVALFYCHARTLLGSHSLSDNGVSALTLFAFMEAAKFAAYWLPFCRKNGITTRSPDEYFASNYSRTIEAEKIKVMYESMKFRKENVVETGRVDDEYITNNKDHQAFSKWRTDHGFTRQNHPSNSGFVGEKPRQRHYRPLFAKPGLCLYTEERLTSPHISPFQSRCP
ncbi:hypothetical protein E1A91_D11G026900v1 [Gossypium mustelinum]|uniref:Uncharacterized protein n=1 Tax=Gossypium mustelinum TaxID=34275 RepID=A0A5D2SLH1_GOSMU|nr:hypothetical protein E1A91_D11G026900v1 [Gossypium mustelinum]